LHRFYNINRICKRGFKKIKEKVLYIQDNSSTQNKLVNNFISKDLSNIFVIGDVHGCYNTLMKLLSKLPQNATLIFVGDLCDKGNYSKEVMEFVINNNHLCVMGNHEYLFYNYIRDAVFRNIHGIWSENEAYGGLKTIKSYHQNSKLIMKHINWIETLPYYIQIDKYFITHGFGLPYCKRKDSCDKRLLYLNRIDDETYKKDWEEYSLYTTVNIFGHCRFSEVLIGKNYYGIDTGCVYGNKLTAIQLGTMNIFEQNVELADII